MFSGLRERKSKGERRLNRGEMVSYYVLKLGLTKAEMRLGFNSRGRNDMANLLLVARVVGESAPEV